MQHSWNWLASRLSPRRIWSGSDATAPRPCLPLIEQLGDRVMLSASSIEVPPPVEGAPVGDSAVLAAVIKGELSLVMSEQNLLLSAGNGLTNQTRGDFENITNAFGKVNDVINVAASDIFVKIGDIKGESLDAKHSEELESISLNFAKIEVTYRALTGGDNQLPAVQFEQDALNLLSKLQAGTGGDLGQKTEDLYAKIADGFNTLDDTIVKVQSDIIARKAGEKPVEYLKVEIKDILVSNINQVTDPDFKSQLLGAEAQTAGTLDALLNPTPPGEGGDGGGGDVIG